VPATGKHLRRTGIFLFLFAVLFLLTSGVVALLNALVPEFMQATAGGLLGMVNGMFNSAALGIVLKLRSYKH
jgi:hypothetical protein